MQKLGISSKTFDGLHIPMLDIDVNIKGCVLANMCRKIQNAFSLSDIYVFKSAHGFNLFSLDKMELSELKTLLEYSYLVDQTYARIGYDRGYYVLGINGKLLYKVMPHFDIERIKSNAHRLFYNDYFGLGISRTKWFDKNTKYELVKYQSGDKP